MTPLDEESLAVLDQKLNELVLLESVQEIMKERKLRLKRNFHQLGFLNQEVNQQREKLSKPPWNLPDHPRPTFKTTEQLQLLQDSNNLKRALNSRAAIIRKQANIVTMKKFTWPRPIATDRINIPRQVTMSFLTKLEAINMHRLLTHEPILTRDQVAQHVMRWINEYNSKHSIFQQIDHQNSILSTILIAYPI